MRLLIALYSKKINFIIFIIAFSVSVVCQAGGHDRKNHFGLEFLIGKHQNAGAVDDLETHRSTVESDPSTADHQFGEEKNLSFAAALLYERSLSPRSRLGLRLAWESIGLGDLIESSVESDGFFQGGVKREYSVNASQRALSVYYRHMFFDKFKLSPYLGGGIGHFRATADVEESSSIFLNHQDLFSEEYDPIERWVPHLITGIDALFPGPYDTSVGFGFSAEYLFNAHFSGFKNSTEELVMDNGRLSSVTTGSGGRSFEADFSGFLLGLVFRVLY
ncbi:MAG: hypothetical protein KCHDKBKB_02278 [Elusimicrobia bacterium]|nr:hypothetical protein [Elusimicrobiota bacterium]